MTTSIVALLNPVTPTKYVTPLSNIMRGYDRFLDCNETGLILGASGESLYVREQHEYADEIAKWVATDSFKIWLPAMKTSKMGSRE